MVTGVTIVKTMSMVTGVTIVKTMSMVTGVTISSENDFKSL